MARNENAYLFMRQIAPCTKILCSYKAIKEPRVRGVIFCTIILLVGRLPKKTYNELGTNKGI